MPKISEIGQCFTELLKKIIVASFYGPRYIEGNTIFNSSIASGENKEYLIAVFKV